MGFIGSEETESDGWYAQAIIDLGGAPRGINSFGEITGPNVAAGEKGYEVAVRFGNMSYDFAERDALGVVTYEEEGDTDAWAIAGSMWCGPNLRTYIESCGALSSSKV